MGKGESSYTIGGNVSWYSHYGKQYGSSTKKLKTELVCDPATPFLGTGPEKTITQRDTRAPASTAVLVTTAETRRHPNVPQQVSAQQRCSQQPRHGDTQTSPTGELTAALLTTAETRRHPNVPNRGAHSSAAHNSRDTETPKWPPTGECVERAWCTRNAPQP